MDCLLLSGHTPNHPSHKSLETFVTKQTNRFPQSASFTTIVLDQERRTSFKYHKLTFLNMTDMYTCVYISGIDPPFLPLMHSAKILANFTSAYLSLYRISSIRHCGYYFFHCLFLCGYYLRVVVIALESPQISAMGR